jgi:hypothetical protein
VSSIRFMILLVIALLGGCGGGREGGSPEELPGKSLPGVYSGVYPCDGCPGIPTTLWLRSDGRFFIEQRYPGLDGRAETNAYNLGRWSWNARYQVLELKGSGPSRDFMRLDQDTLVMVTESDLEHRLTRDATSPNFSKDIRMAGVMGMNGGGASFTECLTGFEVPVSTDGDYERFLHQYRSAGTPDSPTYVELDGRFSWSDDGTPKSLHIMRFITVRDDRSC